MNRKTKTYITRLNVCIARIRFELTVHSPFELSSLAQSVVSPFMRDGLPFTDVCRFDVFFMRRMRREQRPVVGKGVRKDMRGKFSDNLGTIFGKIFDWRAMDEAKKKGVALTAKTAIAFDYTITMFYDRDSRSGTAVQLCNERGEQKALLGQIVREILSIVLPQMNGCIFHASAVSIDGRAHAFLGRSGAGKSTVARMVDPDHMFGDERCIIRRIGRQFYCYTTPWWLQGASSLRHLSRRGRLGSICFLHKSKRTQIERCSMPKALKKIIGEEKAGQLGGYPFLDKGSQKRVIAFYADLFGKVPAFDLRVEKSNVFAREFRLYVKRHMS